MSETQIPAIPNPVVQPWARPYWDAARENKLRLQQCDACKKPIHYPRVACPHCGSERLSWFYASGRGRIYSYTVVLSNAPTAFQAKMPYVVAVITLDEGVRMLSNIVECDQGSLTCDMPVEVVFEKLNEEFTLPMFRPVS